MRRSVLIGCVLATISLTIAACDKKPASEPTPKGNETPTKGLSTASGRSEADQQASRDSLNQIWLGVCSHHDTYMKLPTHSWMLGKGMRLAGGLSWRVHLLPFLKQEGLYKQFKLDEPWDSENNKKLIEKMPKVYASPGVAAEPGQTYFKVFAGPGLVFDPESTNASQITLADGTVNTILAVEGGSPVIWTKPDDVAFDQKKPVPDLSLAGVRKVNIIMFAGAIRTLDLDQISEATLKAAITPAAQDVLGPDWKSAAPEVPKKKEPPVPPPSRGPTGR
ncbi:MAG: DUF1559 domain-containing protein [Gemmataceae bacterium]